MVIINTIHKLLNDEINILSKLIGKQLTTIMCSGVDLVTGFQYYNFIDTINLSFRDVDGFISISAIYGETNLGDDFIKINIKQEKDAVGIKKHKQGGYQHPFVDLNVYPEFIVRKIEVYGDSYVDQSDNTKPYFSIEIENAEQPITENIETENIIILHSDNDRLVIMPYGAFPWIQVALDSKYINNSLFSRDIDGNELTKLKHEIK